MSESAAVAVEGAAQAPDSGDERLAYRGVFQRMLIRPEIGAAIGAVAVWVFFWAVSVPFGKAGGAASILDVASSPLGIMAVAVAMLMIGGEFDLSSGAATGAFGILTILLVRDVAGEAAGAGFSLWLALPISLAFALGLGWFNGTLVNRTSLPSFIVTLASFFILKGAKLGFSKLIIEQIQVGKLDDLEIYAAQTGTSDRGYGFLSNVFAAEWERNSHVWESRDVVYIAATVAGLAIIALGIYELQYRRNSSRKPLGLGIFAFEAVIALAGIAVLHRTDSVGGNVAGAAIIAVGMLFGFYGWCTWRYEAQKSEGPISLGSVVTKRLLIAGVLGVVSILVALILDSQGTENLNNRFSLGTGVIVLIALVIGVILALALRTRQGALMKLPIPSPVLVSMAITVVVAIMVITLFFFMATEQGARAILFVCLAFASALMMLSAVGAARRESPLTASMLLLATSIVVVGFAFFIRSQSLTHKFRTEAFSVMLAVAAVMAVWALMSTRFEERRSPDAAADRFGRYLIIGGSALVLVGITARLLWVTQAELDSGISLTKFSVRTLWFIGFTAVCTWVLGNTKFGSWTFAVGGNKQASRQVGVPANRTKVQLFMLVAFAAWLVGLLLAFRLNTIQASTGDGEEFEYIIAAVVGGTALTGGYGSTLGAAIGALIMAMSVQGIPSARWNSDWRFVFVGAILLLAVIANNFIRGRAASAR